MGCAGPTDKIHGGFISQLAGLKGSAVNVLVPDITEHIRRIRAVLGAQRGHT